MVLVGDANGDGKVAAADATQVLLYTTKGQDGSAIKDGTNTYYAAAYSDGKVALAAADATQILLYTVSPDKANALVNTEVAKGSITE